jgi:cytochrome P450
MAAFQPDALTISRGDLWAQRRQFADAVLEPNRPVHGLAQSWTGICADAARELAGTPIRWADIDRAYLKVVRRVVLGDSAGDDTRVTDLLGELMSDGNKMPGKPGPQYPEFIADIQRYIDKAEPGSLASQVAAAPTPPGGAAGQMVHWMFALKANQAANVLRALAALATHPEQQREARLEVSRADLTTAAGVASLDYLGGCLLEAMRLWPTVGLLVKVAHRDVEFPSGAVLPEGKQVLVYNVFNHRNRALIPYADRFSPGEWVSGSAGQDWSFNFFSHGPQNCPGAGISVFLGQAVMANLLNAGPLSVRGVRLDPGKSLPHAVDLYGLTVHAGSPL